MNRTGKEEGKSVKVYMGKVMVWREEELCVEMRSVLTNKTKQRRERRQRRDTNNETQTTRSTEWNGMRLLTVDSTNTDTERTNK